jgi:transcriptional regulator GlxA family with amidase domain
MDIDILLFDGFDELDAVGPYEVLASARDLGAPFSVCLAGLDGTGPVVAAHGMRLLPDHAAGDRRPDLVVVPGGGWNTRGPLGVRAQVERGVLPARMAGWHADGIRIATVCTGALLAGAAGLLTGRPATTHHENLDDLAAMGAEVVTGRVVDDGDVLSAGGVTSGLDLALHIVEREAGADIASRVAVDIEYAWTGAARA